MREQEKGIRTLGRADAKATFCLIANGAYTSLGRTKGTFNFIDELPRVCYGLGMPRTSRASVGNMCYHVLNRGRNGVGSRFCCSGGVTALGFRGATTFDYDGLSRLISEEIVVKRKGDKSEEERG